MPDNPPENTTRERGLHFVQSDGEAASGRAGQPSIINEKTVADFTRVLDQQGVVYRKPKPPPREEK